MAMRTRREEWTERVRRWRKSGLTAREFGQSSGLNPSTLTYWAWRLGREGRSHGQSDKPPHRRSPSVAAAFVELVSEGIADSRFELELGGGRRLRIPPGFEQSALERLLVVLEAQR